ncbi:MAG: YifB family Mg chelatase-like AAA ATPase [Campylobacterota bacterium]|nr:YifB family Mg chelatase-like AAA ATPase [Campylobacterota bacterium]
MKQLKCATFEGIEAVSVDVESTFTKGLPSFGIVGVVNTAINESKERVKSALLSNEYKFPPKRVTVNLSPSDIKKEGSQFDLPIALLIALNQDEVSLDDWYVFGELGLDGSVKENELFFALILSLTNQGVIQKAIVPQESMKKLSNIPLIQFVGVSTLNEAVAVLKEGEVEFTCKDETDNFPSISIDDIEYFYMQNYQDDFIDVKGQELAKRAALIATAGMHNLLLEGSPGCGKSMIAKRLLNIMPPLQNREILEIAKLHVLEGKEPTFEPTRNFQSPHHSATNASIFGGGSHRAKIGEIGLANKGILFFDELPHFSKKALEALREPLEDRKIRIARVNSKVEYETDFLFVAAMNPCPCGNLLSKEKSCRCSDLEISRYKNRLSDPFLDRIDLYVQMQSVQSSDSSSLSSNDLHVKVIEAFKIQKLRGQSELNGRLSDSDIERFCIMSLEAKAILEKAVANFALSFRSIKKVQKVARTIADLSVSKEIEKSHILEALSFRRR